MCHSDTKLYGHGWQGSLLSQVASSLSSWYCSELVFFRDGGEKSGLLKICCSLTIFFSFKPPLWKLLSRESLLYSWFWVTSGHFFKLVYSVRQSCIVVVCGYAVYSSCHELFDSCQIFLRWSISSPLRKGTIFLFSQLNVATGLYPWSRKQLSMHLLYSKKNLFLKQGKLFLCKLPTISL